LGFCINVLTGDDAAARATGCFAFPVLGLRISRLLRFCDLAISVYFPIVFPGRQGWNSCGPAPARLALDIVSLGMWAVRIGMTFRKKFNHGQLARFLNSINKI